MMKTPNASPVSLQSPKPRQLRNREVSSRFLPSPLSSTTTTTTTTATSIEPGFSSSPRESLSPHQRKTGSTSTRNNNNNTTNEEPSFIARHHQLWPSSSSLNRNSGTLADCISEDRIIEHLERDTKINVHHKPSRTSSKSSNNGYKENGQRPVIDGATRFSLELGYSPEPLSLSLSSSKRHGTSIVSGRLSVDENALYRKSSSRRNSCNSTTNSIDSEYDNNHSDIACSRKTGIEVRSRYMNDSKARRARRGTSDSNTVVMSSSESDSSLLKKLAMKTSIKRANSLTGYKSSKSQWALSPGRTGSPSMSVESMDTPLSFSSLKQTSSPNKAKGVERFWSMGFDLFKSSRKSLLNSNPSLPVGSGNSEAIHHLRLLDNRLMQWRFANARAQAVNKNISHQAQSNLIYAWDGITKLQHSVLKKKIQFGRQKLEMKLNFILYSQMKLLEAWGRMERQHLSTITETKQSLHSVVCRVPLSEGAKVDLQSTTIALKHASDLTASIKSMLTCFSPSVDESAVMLSELAKVVAQEKQLLEEFYDLFQTISVLELQERSAKCNLIQLEGWQWKYQQQQLLHEMASKIFKLQVEVNQEK